MNRSFLSAGQRQRRTRPPPPPGGGSSIPPYIWMVVGSTSVFFGYGYFAFLDEAPLTKRKQWIATSPEWESRLGNEEYQKLLKTFHKDILPRNHRASITVERVGARIATAALDFSREQNLPMAASKNPYTYTVVRSAMANAFVLPGKHVFVMTGLFQYVRDEDELAAVLGHEIAHNLARHAGEKISGSLVVNMVARLSLLVDPSGVLFSVMLPAANLFRELPNSRTQETEADEIGVHIAAKACYDPRAAKRVFSNMEAATEKGAQGPEFLSTHPSHDTRISNFDQWLPIAMQEYESDFGGRCRHVRQEMGQARQQAARVATSREGPKKPTNMEDQSY